MPKVVARALASVLILCTMTQTGKCSERNSQNNEALLIEKVLSEIQLGLIKAQTDAANKNLPQLSSVVLELKTEFNRNENGDIHLYIVSVDGKGENKEAQRIVLTLTPPQPYVGHPIGEHDVSEKISAAIVAAAQGVNKAQNADPPLKLKKLESEIQFVIRSEGGAKLAIEPIGIGIGGNIAKSAVQTITVTFDDK